MPARVVLFHVYQAMESLAIAVVILQKGIMMRRGDRLDRLDTVIASNINLHKQYTSMLEIKYIYAFGLVRITMAVS